MTDGVLEVIRGRIVNGWDLEIIRSERVEIDKYAVPFERVSDKLIPEIEVESWWRIQRSWVTINSVRIEVWEALSRMARTVTKLPEGEINLTRVVAIRMGLEDDTAVVKEV